MGHISLAVWWQYISGVGLTWKSRNYAEKSIFDHAIRASLLQQWLKLLAISSILPPPPRVDRVSQHCRLTPLPAAYLRHCLPFTSSQTDVNSLTAQFSQLQNEVQWLNKGKSVTIYDKKMHIAGHLLSLSHLCRCNIATKLPAFSFSSRTWRWRNTRQISIYRLYSREYGSKT